MRIRHLFALAGIATLAGCFQFEVSAHAGYAPLALKGDLGYQNGSTSTDVKQDVKSAFGLGDTQGSPYGRIAIDTGVPVVSVSAFQFTDKGTGLLNAQFGDIPASLPVRTELDMFNVKGAYAFDISIGPVSIQPGIALDYFDIQIDARDLVGVATEDVALQAPIPLAFLRGELDFGVVSAVAEAGYLQLDIEDINAKLLDIEAMLRVNPIAVVELFVGYRYINLAVDGLIDDDTFDTDITLSGLVFGGGVRF